MATGTKVCVVVPTYNERENVGSLISAIKGSKVPGLELLVVDDSSPDGTGDEVRRITATEAWVHLLVRDSKKGIGSAYLEGFRYAISNIAPNIVIEMDADLQHPPDVLRSLVAAIAAGADVAVASRYVPGGGVSGWSSTRRLVSRGANMYARFILKLRVRDCTSGFRAFRREAVEKLLRSNLPAAGFEFQVASLAALRTGMRVVEVPFTFRPRAAGVSKLGFVDMLRFALRVTRMGVG